VRNSGPSALARLLADTFYRRWKDLADEWLLKRAAGRSSSRPPPRRRANKDKRKTKQINMN
jgi:hypothetical protein